MWSSAYLFGRAYFKVICPAFISELLPIVRNCVVGTVSEEGIIVSETAELSSTPVISSILTDDLFSIKESTATSSHGSDRDEVALLVGIQ